MPSTHSAFVASNAKCLGYGSNITFADKLGALVEDVGNEQKSELVAVFGNLLTQELAVFSLALHGNIERYRFVLGNHIYVVTLLEFLGVVRAQLFNGKIVVAAAHLEYLKTKFGRLLANDGAKLFRLNQVVIGAGRALVITVSVMMAERSTVAMAGVTSTPSCS